jgi:dipeptidyl aminopeptidase/acylaminoacyl peptidase
VRFTTDDGVTLDGWLIPAGRETRAAVILMHGFSWHRLPWLTEFVPWIQPQYNVLQFDFRGHGNSDDAPITLGTLERRDVAAAVRFLQGRGYGPIALMGVSMGASVAIMAAPDLPVAAVVADAAYARLENPIGNRMRQGHYPLPRLGARLVVLAASVRAKAWLREPIQRVAQIAPRGLLLIAPREDALVDWTQAQQLFDAAGDPKELLIVDGAAHSDAHAVGGQDYERRVMGFLGRHLDGMAPV